MIGLVHRLLLALLAAALIGAAPAVASAPRFSGSCDVTGPAHTDGPMGLVPRPLAYSLVATGSCSGTLAGVRVDREPVTLRMTIEDRLGGCASGGGRASGAFRFDRLDLAMPVRSSSLLAPTVFRDGGDGLAVGFVTAYTRLAQQSPQTLQQCVAGTLRSFVLQVVLAQTVRPLQVVPADAPTPSGPAGFSGTCDVPGTALTPGEVGVVPERRPYAFTGRGTCTGKLDGQPVARASVTVDTLVDDRLQGCASGASTSTSTVRFLASGRELRLLGVHAGPVALVRGAGGGSAVGAFTVVTELARYDPGTLGQCLAGTATGEGPMRWLLQTLAPLR